MGVEGTSSGRESGGWGPQEEIGVGVFEKKINKKKRRRK